MSYLLSIQNIYWREPLWLLLSFQPFLMLLIKLFIGKNNIGLYADKHLQPWVVVPTKYLFSKKIINKNTAYLIAWALFSIALAGPRIALTHIDNKQLFTSNIMLVIDHSRSMKAMDIQPSRIQRALIETYELLEKAQGYRVGISVFSARPHLYVPLTSDHTALKTYLHSLDKLAFPTLGSDFFSAIVFAQKELQQLKGKSAIVLITDGDFEAITKSQLKTLADVEIPLYILGVGSVEGEAILLESGKWLKHNNQHVISKMNEAMLSQLSSKLNGKYSPAYDDDTDWEILFDQGIAKINADTDISADERIIWKELFSYFLIPSIILFYFSLSSLHIRFTKNITLFAIISFFTLTIPPKQADAFEIIQSNERIAHQSYKINLFEKSIEYYKRTDGFQRYFGLASNLYKMGHYQDAIKQYTLAILSAENDEQLAASLYNLGNSYFRTGNFSSAINSYNDVLRYKPADIASIHNIKISHILKKNIEQRIKEKEKIISLIRQGRGSRSANINNDTDIGNNTSVSLSDNEYLLQNNIPLPELPDMHEDTVKKLISAGLKNIKLAKDSSITNQQTKTETETNISINMRNIRRQTNNINDSQILLWKRLFEMEEGFPAPVEKPKILPETKPW